MKWEAIQFYEGLYLDQEGNELPFGLEHITSEDLHNEFIYDCSDDHDLDLMFGNIEKVS
jgi:hypothetical protein